MGALEGPWESETGKKRVIPCRGLKGTDSAGKQRLCSVGLQSVGHTWQRVPPRLRANSGWDVSEQRSLGLWLRHLVAEHGGAQLMTPEVEAGQPALFEASLDYTLLTCK